MSTFLIIFLVISLIGGLMSRSSGRVEVKESKKPVFANKVEPALNKEEFKERIVNKASDTLYAYNNGNLMIKLCQDYFHRFGWDVVILEIIITALVTYKRFDEAFAYANFLCCNELSYMWGFFFKAEICWYKGQISEGNRFFRISVNQWGMDEQYVNTRKKELMWEVTANPADRYVLDEERRRLQ